jgi:hypothetical protein
MRGATTARGYGTKHQTLRKRWAPIVKRGEAVCARCNLEIPPDPTVTPCPKCGRLHTSWDLGHDDLDRSRWTGPEHQCCNRATNGRDVRRPVRANWW